MEWARDHSLQVSYPGHSVLRSKLGIKIPCHFTWVRPHPSAGVSRVFLGDDMCVFMGSGLIGFAFGKRPIFLNFNGNPDNSKAKFHNLMRISIIHCIKFAHSIQ